MDAASEGQQFELFESASQPAGRRPRLAIGQLHLRHDHAVLVGIVGLLGCSVVFALGVERGKRLARAEQPVLPAVASASPAKPGPIETSPVAKTVAAAPAQVVNVSPRATDRSGFAIQVVAFRQPQLAQRELQRLKQRGEPAFLVTRQERIVLYVGPFASKATAAAKLAGLKRQYQDCFIRTLTKTTSQTG